MLFLIIHFCTFSVAFKDFKRHPPHGFWSRWSCHGWDSSGPFSNIVNQIQTQILLVPSYWNKKLPIFMQNIPQSEKKPLHTPCHGWSPSAQIQQSEKKPLHAFHHGWGPSAPILHQHLSELKKLYNRGRMGNSKGEKPEEVSTEGPCK